MTSARTGIALRSPQRAGLIAWPGHGDPELRVGVGWDDDSAEEVVEVYRDGDASPSPRWRIQRAPEGGLIVTGPGVPAWDTAAASVQEAWVIIEMADAAERAGRKRDG